MRVESRPLHVAAMASIAVVQPLFDMLARSPEFLLAHDLGPAEILSFVGVLGLALPLTCALVVAVLHRIHPASARAAATALIGLFVALVALYAGKNIPGLWAPFAIAAASGFAGAVLYHRVASARVFATWLVPAVVVIPLMFLLRPGVHSLVRPQEQHVLHASASATPVVFVVFDGLPLTALLDGTRQINRGMYPSFAALADQSTWYRNATTVSDYTQWALPAILSGRYPVPKSLPIASDHQETLFTLLGASHAVAVHEPITRLCPQSLCDHGGDGIAHELMDFAEPLSIAYVHALLPERMRSMLPAIDLGWAEGVPPSEKPGEMWLRGGEHSRRSEVLAFINSIVGDGDLPSLHFIHVLLPHIPLAYLPDGQRYGTERVLPGLLDTRDRWEDDEWAATQGYRKFLLQVGYVDTLLGQLIERLKDVDLYDRALIVVTSDHGGSFRAGRAFRRLTDDTVMDIAPIPLLIKLPHQRQGVTSDRNVETIDILPTIADVMNVEPPWKFDGVSVAQGPEKTGKTIYYNGAKQRKTLPNSLTDAVEASVAHKLRLFGTAENRYRIPLTSPKHELIGRDVDDLRVVDAPEDFDFALDVHGDFSRVDPRGRFLPAQLAGRAKWTDSSEPAVVAVAVNGVVRATTSTYRYAQRGIEGFWTVLLAPDAFREGENDVEVYLVRGVDTPVLHRTAFSHARPVNLLSNAAAYGMGVSYEGLYDRQGNGERAVRWTDGDATITVPRSRFPAPRSMRITLATAGPVETALTVRVNGCEVFEGTVPTSRWSRVFSLPACGSDDESMIIELRSRPEPDPASGRPHGVAVEGIDLLNHPWPPSNASQSATSRKSLIRFASALRDGDTVGSTERLAVTVANRGDSIWPTPVELGREEGAVRLGVLWFRKGQTAQPVAIQRIELPGTLVPGDSVDVAFDLVPNAGDGRLPAGEYEAWIGLLQEGVSWFYTSGDSVRKLRVVHDARP